LGTAELLKGWGRAMSDPEKGGGDPKTLKGKVWYAGDTLESKKKKYEVGVGGDP